MKNIIPYSKEIPFESKLAEICSISLEHELHINDNEIEGNFIISGEYKSHEVSVNKESFNYKLPFSVDVTDKIEKDSLSFEITDFTYEILDYSILKVNIEFAISASEKEEEKKEEENFEIEETRPELDREEMMEEINDLFLSIENNQKEEPNLDETIILPEEDRLDQESAELILDSATNKEDEYTTYFIHLVKSGDTIESIVSTYQTDIDTLKKYNTIENLNVGDKLIIPSVDE